MALSLDRCDRATRPGPTGDVEAQVADLEDVAQLEGLALDLLAVDEGPAAAAGTDDGDIVAVVADLAVVT